MRVGGSSGRMWRSLAAYAVVGAIALALRVWGLDFSHGLPRGRPDEELFLIPALRMFGGRLDPELLAYGFPEGYAFLLHGALRLYARWLAWSSGAEVNLGCVFAVAPSNLIIVGRWVSALLGAATVVPTALIARRLVPPRLAPVAALVAALLLAVNYLHGRDSHFAVTDASVTFFLTWAVWAFVALAEERRARYALLAGLLAGFAVGVKWIALFVLPVLGLVLAAYWALGRDGTLLRRSVVVVLALLLSCAGLLALSPNVGRDLHAAYSGIASHQMRYDPAEVSRFLLDPTANPGRGIYFHSLVTLPIALGRAGMIAALVGIAFAFRYAPRAAATCAGVVLCVFGAAVGPIRLLFVRYCMPVMPVLVAFAAAGIVHLAALVRRRGERPAVFTALLTALSIIVAAEPALRLIRADRILSRPDTRDLAARWILAHGPPDATVGPEVAYTCVYAVPRTGLAACNAALPAAFRGAVPNLPGDRSSWAAEIRRGRAGWGVIADEALNDYWNTPSLSLKPDYLVRGIPILSCGKPAPTRGLDPLDACWEEAARFSPGTPACGAVYDLFDQFYLPYAGFDGVERPGPETVIYRNRCRHSAAGTS